MNAGFLGKVASSANNWLLVYEVGADVKFSTIDIHCANITEEDTDLSLAITTGSANSIDVADYILGGATIKANGIYGQAVQPVSPGEKVYMKAGSPGVSCQIRGYEETVGVVDQTSPT